MPVSTTTSFGDTSQPHRLELLLELGARRHPHRNALTYYVGGEPRHISYLDLWTRARRAACALSPLLPQASDAPFVTLFLPTGPNQVVAILATLIAGAAFVPIALDAAPARCRAIVEQSGSGVIITESEQRTRLDKLLLDSTLDNLNVLDIDSIDCEDVDGIVAGGYPTTDPAYVLFSSGTTGTPKGIVTSHAAVLSYCQASNKVFQATSNDKWLRAASYTFDVSIEELFVPLSIGAEVVIQPAGVLESLPSYLRFLDYAGITFISMATALWHQLVKHTAQGNRFPASVRLLAVGGEACMTEALISWRKHVGACPRIVNAYGPTETTISATLWEASDFSGRAVMPIGRALENSKSYVLDQETRTPVARGSEGLLYVSGPGLAMAYLGNAELTQEKFVANPFSDEPGYERMYNTGDLVIEDEDGLLHFCGRADLQVQVRGFRVEIEAIEACLLTHPNVGSVAIVDVTEQQTTSLNAYIVQSSNSPLLYVDDFVAHCQKSLAHYEIPARFFRIEAMPLNQSEKIDRRALAKLPREEYTSRDTLEQNNAEGFVDMALAELWCECLDSISVPQLHARSHFLRLGGHSLTLITLSAKIASTCGVSLTAVELLRHPELGMMSKLVAEKKAELSVRGSHPKIEAATTVSELYPLTLPQERLFSVQQNSPDSPFFNDGLAINIRGRVDEQRLVEAVKEILGRHSVLRARLVQLEHGAVEQRIVKPDEAFFSRVFIAESLDRPRAEQQAHRIFAQPLDLFSGPLIKVALLTSHPEEHILVVCAHHIIWDGFSDNIFLNELLQLYKGEQLGNAPSYFDSFPDAPNPDPSRIEALKSYLADVPQTLDLPNDFSRPETQSYSRGRSVYFELDSGAMSRLLKRLGGSPASAALTAFAVAIHLAAARQVDFMVGVPFANRASAEAAKAIGFFVNLLPVRMNFANFTSLDEFYAQVKKDLIFLAEMEDVPFDALVSSLEINRFSSRDSLLQVSFAFQDAPEGSLSDGTTFSRFPLSNGAARTDLTCFVEVGKTGRLAGELEYNTDIFAHSTIESMAGAVTQILDAWAGDSLLAIDNIPFKAPHISTMPLPSACYQSLGSYLSSIGERFADLDAVYEDGTGTTYTYSQLFSKAQRIQHLVRPLKSRGNSVMLLVDRSADVLAAEIGVSLAGMTWIPCDVGQPKSRICDIATDAGPACVVAHPQVLERLSLDELALGAPVIPVPSDWDDEPSQIQVDDAGELAYIIYTSGTTGKPKGVTIGHQSIIAFLEHISTWAEYDTPFHSILTSNVAFDGSISQMYAGLVTGGCVKMPKIGGEQDGEYLSLLMKKSPTVNYLCTTSAAVRMWLDQMAGNDTFFPADFQQILLGGDALTPTFVRRVMTDAIASPKVQLKNVYGPTEGTVFSSYGVLSHTDMGAVARRCRVPIDRLMPHVEMTIAGPTGDSLPRGFVGEIVIWGDCLTPGYANLPQINAERFLTRNGVRGWRSGDLGRQLPCGRFEILGRMDSMCKIRGGFRVELSEIEAQIASFEQVADCYVSTIILPGTAEKQIASHVVFQQDPNQDAQTVADWKQMFEGVNEEIQTFEEEVDLGFDYRGWTSSFDRKHISSDDMAEWINTTVDRILSLGCFQGRRPRVLEIGSGTGMILFRVAPHAEKYVGLDLSSAVVSQVRRHAQKLKYDHVHVSPAHLFEEVINQNQRFDLIICNSVAQYFPSFQYLRSLVDRAANYLGQNGHLFLGDLRNFSTMQQFSTAVALADRPQTVSNLAKAIQNCLNLEEELLVSPDYFALLARDDRRFDSAATYLRRGLANTEMNLFRFDVVMHAAQQKASSVSLPKEYYWSHTSLEELASSVKGANPILLRDIPNARIADAHLVSTLPLDGSQSLSEILELARIYRDSSTVCHPEHLTRRLSRGDTIALPLCSLHHPECFDVLLVNSSTPQAEVQQMCFEAQLRTVPSHGNQIFSNKQKAEVSRETLRLLHEYLSRRIPAYMIPDFVVPVDDIPLTSSHKVDKSRLPQATPSHRFIVERQSQVEWSAADIARRPIVEAILRIFSTVLFTDKTLSPRDDFFACGGHSLIATKATSMIRREFNIPLPFTAIIMNPTASELAARVESIKAESRSTSQLPPNVVMLHPAAIGVPRTALFVFHPIGGGLTPFAPLVKQLGKELGDLVIYGVAWDPERNLTSLDKMVSAYAVSISAIDLPTGASRYLLGWSFGGVVATKVANRLPQGSTRLLVLDAPTTSAIQGTIQESSFARDLAEHMLEVLNISSSGPNTGELAQVIRASGVSRHDTSKLSTLVSKHLPIPPWVTDIELERFVRGLCENFDVLMDLNDHGEGGKEPISESNVVLNLQATRGLCIREGFSEGLGWTQFEKVECNHDDILTLPAVAIKVLSVLQNL